MAINRAQEFVIRVIKKKILEGEIHLPPLQSSLLLLYNKSDRIIPPSECAQLLGVDISQISRANSQIIAKITEKYYDPLSFEIPKLFFDLGELKRFEQICKHQITHAQKLLNAHKIGEYLERMAAELSGYPNLRSILRLMETIYATAADPRLAVILHHKNAIALSLIRRRFLSAHVWRQRGRTASNKYFTTELQTLKSSIFEDGHETTIYRYFNTAMSFHTSITHDYVALKKIATEYLEFVKGIEISGFSANKISWISMAYIILGEHEAVINIVDSQTMKKKLAEKNSFTLMLYYYICLIIRGDIYEVKNEYYSTSFFGDDNNNQNYKIDFNHNIVKSLICFFESDYIRSRNYVNQIIIKNNAEKYTLSVDIFSRILDSAISAVNENSKVAIDILAKNNKWFGRNGFGAKTYERIFIRSLMHLCELREIYNYDLSAVIRLRHKLNAGTGSLFGKMLDHIVGKTL